MNTFIKRSMMLGVSLVFIGVSVVPACAQKKGIIKGAKAALGKKPPLTGTAPVVKPVTPRVPPTLQGAAVPARFAVPDAALNTVIEREIQKIHTDGINTNFKDLPDLPKKRIEKNPHLFRYSVPSHLGFVEIDFNRYMTYNMPRYVPININPEIDVYNLPNSRKDLPDALKKVSGGFTRPMFEKMKNIFRKVDQAFFVRINGQLFVDVSTIASYRSYQEAVLIFSLDTIEEGYRWLNRASSEEFKDFINMRNQQIIAALKQKNGIDNTTQRTAEEIKNLVENLDPDNPLRQHIEYILWENGYLPD